jgi:hypothetical protein
MGKHSKKYNLTLKINTPEESEYFFLNQFHQQPTSIDVFPAGTRYDLEQNKLVASVSVY